MAVLGALRWQENRLGSAGQSTCRFTRVAIFDGAVSAAGAFFWLKKSGLALHL
jgi:hypothetical protein